MSQTEILFSTILVVTNDIFAETRLPPTVAELLFEVFSQRYEFGVVVFRRQNQTRPAPRARNEALKLRPSCQR